MIRWYVASKVYVSTFAPFSGNPRSGDCQYELFLAACTHNDEFTIEEVILRDSVLEVFYRHVVQVQALGSDKAPCFSCTGL